MGILISLLMVFIFGPAIAIILFFVALRDLADYYGGWLFPAMFGLIAGIQLQLIPPSNPDLPFESLVEVIAGSHLVGVPTPLVLISVGVISILAKPVFTLVSIKKGHS
ncbi:hypothetical protein G7009_18160 [Pseudomonas capeferrum]|uniref:hypothetical protein n=1 Tax=Bacteria TaxID=2 RepID=UPI0015E3677F|nr:MULTISPECIES: hypothetical protein [Pseudomonas]MBA1203649.1 hypothetical protein [Pseudomonas capeferrum]